MMPEIALNVLDIAQNSVRAEASLIQISVDVDEAADTLTITIEDNGCGMTKEQVSHVTDPFFTTRTTRKIGLSHIDRMPLGDMNGTIYTLITFNTQIDFLYTYTFNKRSFKLDTREFKDILEGVPLNNPEVAEYIRQFLNENSHEVDGGTVI